MIERRRWPSATPSRASDQQPASSGPRWRMAEVIRPSTESADSSSPPGAQKPASPHTGANPPTARSVPRCPAPSSQTVKRSIPFDEFLDAVADRSPWREASRPLKVGCLCEGRRDISRLKGKELTYGLLTKCLFKKGD